MFSGLISDSMALGHVWLGRLEVVSSLVEVGESPRQLRTDGLHQQH